MYCVSFPKSGRTYLRYMIGKYFQLKDNLEEKNLLDYSEKYGLIFKHAGSYKEDDSVSINDLKNESIIWLKRDPIDTLVSFFYHVTYRKKEYKKNLSSFIRSEEYGIQKLIWFENEVSKLNLSMLINYEDMYRDPEMIVSKVLKKMTKTYDKDILKEAVYQSTFTKMRDAEITGRVNISEKDYIDKTDERQLKVRKGQIGTGKDYLHEEDIEYINEIIHNNNKG